MALTLGGVFSLPSPGLVPQSLKLGNPETHPMSLPAAQEETMPFGTAENPRSGRNLHVPPKAIPHIRRKPGLKTPRLKSSQNPTLNTAPGKFP